VKLSKGQTYSSCASRTRKNNNEIVIEKGIVAPIHSMKAYRESINVAQNID
jgi:hypothetical protein